MTLTVIQKKFQKSLQVRGPVGTLKFSASWMLRLLRNLTPQNRRAAALKRAADEDFDRRYGVDTSGVVPLSNLDVKSSSWVFGGAYQAVGDHINFGELLKDRNIPYEDCAFVDLGSGKGRALLLASTLPFDTVVGVEFSDALHHVAEENVRRWPQSERKCRRFELRCMDAAEYEFPFGAFVLFMYNPFARPIMERVVENLKASFHDHPRRIVVVYFTPKQSELWDGVRFLKKVLVHPGYHVYDTL